MVKARTIGFLLKLEQLGKITRADKFQGILNAIAGDVRSKHRKRIERQQEMESMNEALRQLTESKKQLEEKIKSYHSYVDNTMQTMQRGGGKRYAKFRVCDISLLTLLQEIRHSVHPTVLPPPRLATSGRHPAIWIVPVHRQVSVRKGHPPLHRSVFSPAI